MRRRNSTKLKKLNRLCIVTQFYPPDFAATGQLSEELATYKELILKSSLGNLAMLIVKILLQQLRIKWFLFGDRAQLGSGPSGFAAKRLMDCCFVYGLDYTCSGTLDIEMFYY